MARDTWTDSLDQPSDMILYEGVYHLKDKGFKYGDKVTVTVEHGVGVVAKLEEMLENIKTSLKEQKESKFADKTVIELTEALVESLEEVLEIDEPLRYPCHGCDNAKVTKAGTAHAIPKDPKRCETCPEWKKYMIKMTEQEESS